MQIESVDWNNRVAKIDGKIEPVSLRIDPTGRVIFYVRLWYKMYHPKFWICNGYEDVVVGMRAGRC